MDQTPYDGWAAMGESSRPFVQYWMDPTAFVSAFVCSFRGLFACVLSPGLRFISFMNDGPHELRDSYLAAVRSISFTDGRSPGEARLR